VHMCTVLLPPGGYPIAVNKYIISYHIISYHIISYHIINSSLFTSRSTKSKPLQTREEVDILPRVCL
jgi:hypothetical protein